MQLKDILIGFSSCILIAVSVHYCELVDFDCYDLLLSIPLIRFYSSHDLYSSNDLIIQAGQQTPFFVYKILGFLVSLNIDVEKLIPNLYIASLSASLIPLWLISYHLFRDKSWAIIYIFLIVSIEPAAGAINWTNFPTRCLISSSFALPFFFFSIYYSLIDRFFASIIISIFTILVHPGFGLIAFLISLSWAIRIRSKASSQLLGIGLVGILFVLIFLILFKDNLRQFFLDPVHANNFWYIFKAFSHHAFFQSHWPDSFMLFFISLSILIKFYTTTPLKFQIYLKHAICVAAILCFFYSINLYFLEIPEIALTFLFRSTLIVKIFSILVFINWIRKVTVDSVSRQIFIILLILSWTFSLISANDNLALISLTSILLFICPSGIINHLLFLGSLSLFFELDSTSLESTQNSFEIILSWVILAISILRLFTINSQVNYEENKLKIPLKSRELILFILLLNLLVNSGSAKLRLENLHHFVTDDFIALTEWCKKKTTKDALFVVELKDPKFLTFRVLSNRSPFVLLEDINQLAYSPSHYLQAIQRLRDLGFDGFISQSKYGVKSPIPELRLSHEQLINIAKKYRVNYLITKLSNKYPSIMIAYENSEYLVYDLSSLNN